MRSESACGGEEALKMLRAAAVDDPYELAIIDMQMPNMDGLMLARAVKNDPVTAGTRLLMLTSLGNHLNATDMKASGIAACVLKPVKQSHLFDRLAEVMASKLPSNVAVATPTPVVVKPAPAPDPARAKVRILLAEDNRINQRVALGLLQNLGYSADIAVNGVEAIAALEKTPYDIIFMDCQMPELDGYDATRQIRAMGKTASPRIIAMTANAMRGEAEKCLEAGMDDYLAKPVRIETLRETLLRWLPESALKD